MNAIPPTRILMFDGDVGDVYTALTLERILDTCRTFLSRPPLRDFFNRLVEERVGMAPRAGSDGYAAALVEQSQ